MKNGCSIEINVTMEYNYINRKKYIIKIKEW